MVQGIYLGGFKPARRGLAAGTYSPDQFRVFMRHAGWGPGQLEAECERGVWFPAAASPAAVLAGPASESASRADRGAKWFEIMRLMGGQYAALADAAQGTNIWELARREEEAEAARPEEEEAAEGPGAAGPGPAAGRPQGRAGPPPEDCKDGGCI